MTYSFDNKRPAKIGLKELRRDRLKDRAATSNCTISKPPKSQSVGLGLVVLMITIPGTPCNILCTKVTLVLAAKQPMSSYSYVVTFSSSFCTMRQVPTVYWKGLLGGKALGQCCAP
jgi:hypothetical protein